MTLKDLTASKNNASVISSNIEYRKKNGNWTDYHASGDNAVDLTSCQQKGATLYFRTKASAKTTSLSDLGDESDEFIAGSFHGKEVKVTIKKKANAPKIAANYSNQTVTIPKGVNYRITTSDAERLSDWQPKTSQTLLLKKKDLGDLIRKGGFVEVKIPATKTKPESKIGQLESYGQPIISVKSSSAGGNVTTNDVIPIKEEGTASYFGIEKDYLMEPEYNQIISKVWAIPQKNRYGKTISYSLEFVKNVEEILLPYEIIIQNNYETPEPDAKGAKLIKASNNSTDKDFTSTVKNLKPGQVVYIRNAYNPKSGFSLMDGLGEYFTLDYTIHASWSSEYVLLGTIPQV